MSVTINGTNGLTFNDNSTQTTAATGFGFKNRIINGAMVIDQRNAGASVTPAQDNYMADRWKWGQSQASKFTAQQVTSAPAGFINSLKMTVASAVTIGASDYFIVYQPIEGLNVSDLAWGTASAAAVTLSFWVNCSLTGTFGGSLRNSAGNRSYPFSYTVSSANTWEQKTITISGDQSGTWLTTNGVGIYLQFGLGVGSTLSGTAGSWSANNYLSATGATSVVGTNGATFYITGVQLEKGSTATSFDYRPYGTELQLCQRYYEMSYDIGTAPATATTTGMRNTAWAINGANGGAGPIVFQTPKRSSPTIATYDGAGTANNVSTVPNGSTTFTNGRAYVGAPYNISTNGFMHQGQTIVGNVLNFIHFTASVEL